MSVVAVGTSTIFFNFVQTATKEEGTKNVSNQINRARKLFSSTWIFYNLNNLFTKITNLT
jgi:hypothetical protein